MANNFLEELKKAVEEGNFNSEAAKKINDIDKLAESMLASGSLKNKDLNNNIDPNVKFEETEEAIAKLKEIKLQDEINAEIANISNMEDDLLLHFDYIKESLESIESKYDKENPLYNDLFVKIDELKSIFEKIS
jgi:hypothetical protein